MIDEWPQELIDVLSPPSRPFAVWIGSGLASELGYPDWPRIAEKFIARARELDKPHADIAQIQRHVRNNHLTQAAETAYDLLGQSLFEQVLSEAFHIREHEEGLQACEDVLFLPFTVFVTTNYNRSLSQVATRLADDNRLTRLGDVIYPGGSPDQLWPRSIHYLHSDIHHVSDIVMTDSTFSDAYGPSGPQRKVVETLGNFFNILFIGTDFTDTDVRRVFRECKGVFRSRTQTLRYALTAAHGRAPPTRGDPVLQSLGIKPIYYSVSEPTENPPYPEKLPPRHAALWKMISQLRLKSEAYVKLADLGSRLSSLPPEYETLEGA